jgi:hypothetical protein
VIARDPDAEVERELDEETAMDRQEDRERTEPVRCPRCGTDLSQVGIEDAARHVAECSAGATYLEVALDLQARDELDEQEAIARRLGRTR